MRSLRRAKRAFSRLKLGAVEDGGGNKTVSGSSHQVWEDNLENEVGFWNRYLSTSGLEWPDEFRMRLDPSSVVTDELVGGHLRRLTSIEVSILDVGAGPLTIINKTFPGKPLAITATDPLADDYDRLLTEARIDPPVRTVRCEGERLLTMFEPDTFDIAFARNALDHSYEPIRVIRNMIELVKAGGFILLKHRRNEAQTVGYEGLHRWNFDNNDDNDLILWNPETRHSVRASFKHCADVDVGYDGEWIYCALTKTASVAQ